MVHFSDEDFLLAWHITPSLRTQLTGERNENTGNDKNTKNTTVDMKAIGFID